MRKETVGCSPMVTEAEGEMSGRRREHNTPSESPCTQLKRVTKREALADQGFARCRDAKPEAPHWLSRPFLPAPLPHKCGLDLLTQTLWDCLSTWPFLLSLLGSPIRFPVHSRSCAAFHKAVQRRQRDFVYPKLAARTLSYAGSRSMLGQFLCAVKRCQKMTT